MKNNKNWVMMAMWAVSVGFMMYYMRFVQKPVAPPPMHPLVAQIQKLELSAGTDKAKLKAVADDYVKLGNNRAYNKTEEAAEVRLHAGDIYETKLKDYNTAEKTYAALTQNFDPKTSKAAADAAARLPIIQAKITDQHRHEIGYKAIDWLVALTGRNQNYSYALALLIITIIFKGVTTPLSHAQYKSMKEMQKIQPLVKQLQEKYKDNQQELGKKMMDLYKEHGVNPLSGCLPLLIQMPMMIYLYRYVITPYQFEFTKGHFLWIGSHLSKLWPAIIGGNLAMPDIPLVIIYTISMIISQKLSVVDPTQAQEQKIMAYAMPVMFAFLFRTFASAFMLYWLFFNIISTVQQYRVLKQGNGPGSSSDGTTVLTDTGTAVIEEVQPKKSSVIPGNKAKRRRRRFDALPSPQSVLQPTPGG